MKQVTLWIKTDQLDVTCFIISLFTVQHVSNVSTSIFRSLRLIADLFHVLYCSGSVCVGFTVWFGWGGVVSLCRLKHCFILHKDTAISHKLLKMDVLTFETCWTVNSEIIKQVTSSWSVFIQSYLFHFCVIKIGLYVITSNKYKLFFLSQIYFPDFIL